MAGKIGIMIMVGFVFISCAKEELKETLRITTPLADKGSIDMTIDIEFPDPESRRSYLDNSQKVKYALLLMFKSYNANDLVNRGISNNTIRKVLSSRFNIPYSALKISEYDVRDANNQAVKKKNIFNKAER